MTKYIIQIVGTILQCWPVLIPLGILALLFSSLFFGIPYVFDMNMEAEVPLIKYERIMIEKVLYHEHSKYSVLVKNGKNLNVLGIPTGQLVQDLDRREKMYIERPYSEYRGFRTGKIYRSYPDSRAVWYIHIHDPDEIGAGGWDHGKFGKGQTTVIE